MSSLPLMGTCQSPFGCMVQDVAGIISTAVWSQLMMSWLGMSNFGTQRPILLWNLLAILLISSGRLFTPFVTFLLVYPILSRWDLAHVLWMVTEPPYSSRMGGSAAWRSPVVPANTCFVLMLPPLFQTAPRNAFVISSNSFPISSGRLLAPFGRASGASPDFLAFT